MQDAIFKESQLIFTQIYGPARESLPRLRGWKRKKLPCNSESVWLKSSKRAISSGTMMIDYGMSVIIIMMWIVFDCGSDVIGFQALISPDVAS